MNTEIIFENKEERESTEKVLGTFKVQKINENMDVLVEEILEYAKNIDTLMEENEYETNYLEMVSNLNEVDEIHIIEDIKEETLRENVDDLIKRINTRIKLLKENSGELKKLNDNYNLDNIDIEDEIKKTNLI